MIEFRHVNKYYVTTNGRKTLLNDFSMVIPAGEKVALMGRNGVGKSTMIGMISGTVSANSGRIRREGTMSWPMGFSGSFAADISGRQNALFVARIYGVDAKELLNFVQDFSELGDFFDMPVRSYSSGMRARLAFGLSMGLGFDWYLVDEVTSVGDTAFRKKSLEMFRTRLTDAGLIMVSHSTSTLRDYCKSGIVLEGGNGIFFPDIEEAIQQHEMNMDNAFSTAGKEQDLPAQMLYNEGKRKYQNGDYSAAEELISQALIKSPEKAEWHALLGAINRHLGANGAALDAYKMALNLENEPRYHIARAQIFATIGQVEEAEKTFLEVLRMKPGDSAASYAMGRYRYLQGRLDEAETFLLTAIESHPENIGANWVLAQLYDAKENYTQAIQYYTVATRLMPDNPKFLLGYARSQMRNADLAGAEATYQRVLVLDPKNKAAKAAIDKIIQANRRDS